MKTRRFTLAFTIGGGDEETSVADKYDRDQLLAALQAAHARDHELVQHIGKLDVTLAEQNELLRTRTIERDHFAQDGHLWALCLAWLVRQEDDEWLGLPADEVNACEGLMLAANVADGYVRITVTDRPQPSKEGGGEGA